MASRCRCPTRPGRSVECSRCSVGCWGRRHVVGLIPANPCTGLWNETSGRRSGRRDFPSLDSEAGSARLIASSHHEALPGPGGGLGHAGPRQGEARGLRWQDVDTSAGGLIRIRHQFGPRNGELVEPKTTAAKREVPMPPSLARMLAEASPGQPVLGRDGLRFRLVRRGHRSRCGTSSGVAWTLRRGEGRTAESCAGTTCGHVAASALIESGSESELCRPRPRP